MRVSLSSGSIEAACSKCAFTNNVLQFLVVADGFSGAEDPICAACLSEGTTATVPMESLAVGPTPRRKGLRKAKKASLRQELDIDEEFGTKRQPGSGNQPGAKGDNRRKGSLRLEAKHTEAQSFSLKLEELHKISGEASNGEMAGLVIDYLQPGTKKLIDRFVVIHSEDFKELNQLREEHGSSQHRRPKRPA